MTSLSRALLTGLLLLTSSACVRTLATGKLADALSGTSGSFAKDDDPELIEDALPFALKTMESLVPEQPEHRGLLAATSSGFTQYAYGFLVEHAARVESKDSKQADHLRERAKKLLHRARGYGIQGLALRVPQFEQRFRANPKDALAPMTTEDVPLLFWTAAALGAEISLDKENLELVADLPQVESLLRRALALEESYDQGAIHELLMTYELSRPDGGPSSRKSAQMHYDRARELSKGTKLSLLVNWAESDSVKRQDKAQFIQLLDEVLAFPVDKAPDVRLANIIAQTRAKRLKAQVDDLFL